MSFKEVPLQFESSKEEEKEVFSSEVKFVLNGKRFLAQKSSHLPGNKAQLLALVGERTEQSSVVIG